MAQDKLRREPRLVAKPRKSSKGRGTELDFLVGRRLREARLLTGITQGQLGQELGVSFQAVQKYEQGENRLSASRLFRAARLLAQTVSYFFDEISGDGAADGPPAFTRDEIDLVRHYRLIASEDVREHLLQVAKRISEVDGAGEMVPAHGGASG